MYDDARDAFVEAQKFAPCPIAYWGEAMTYDHPIWGEQDTAAGKAALEKIPAGAKLSKAERGLIEAAQALYAKDHAAWMERLARLHDELPGDDEVALFYALSLYAESDHGSNAARAKLAADIAEDAFQRNPGHPGAAHYLIHSCDAPDEAQRALKAAKQYAQIAPAAAHALHMPSHIFVQLGMWHEVETSNIASVKAGEAVVARRKQPVSRADWHSYSWLASARLELGKADEVLPMIERVRELAKEEPLLQPIQAELAGKWLSATHAYERTEELLQMAPVPAEDEPGYVDSAAAYEGCHHAPYLLEARLSAAHARLDAAAADGDETAAAKFAGEWNALRARIAAKQRYHQHYLEMGELAAAAKVAQAHSVRVSGDINEAIAATRAFADAEDNRPALGPWPWTPAREELGELYMRSHRFQEAEEAFQAALKKRPNRLHALEGLSEAARAIGDQLTANDARTRLSAQVR
jgi:tetratricopeptide (TPR) repeat protein